MEREREREREGGRERERERSESATFQNLNRKKKGPPWCLDSPFRERERAEGKVTWIAFLYYKV